MFLDKFLKPKWQHSNPQVRKQALLKLAPQDPEDRRILVRLAEQDADAEVRRTAVKRLSELDRLRRVAQEDADAGVREVASARYRQLLAGGTDEADLQQRIDELALSEDETVLAHVARRGREPELRVAALQRLNTVAVLEEAAINDTVAKVRLAALERLREPASLERVMRQTRERDRKVWRAAKDTLEAVQRREREREEAKAQREQLIREAAELAAGPWRRTLAAECLRLENRWQAVAPAAGDEQGRRFAEAIERGRALAERPPVAPAEAPATEIVAEPALPGEPAEPTAEAVAARAADLAALEALLERLQTDAEVSGPRLLELQREVDAADGAPPADAEAAERHRHVHRLLADYLSAGRRFIDHEAEIEEAVAAAATAADEATLRSAAGQLRRAVERVAWNPPLPAPALLERAGVALDEVQQQQARLQEQRAQRLAQLEGVLEELDVQLAAGHLKDSQRLLSKAQKLAGELPQRDQDRARKRLRHYAGRVNELKDWRRFATLPKQEELCEQMEALLGADLEPPALAERIKALQEAWKATGGSDSPQAQQLWERFRGAADRAFEPCKAWFDDQARLRRENLQQRQRLAEQLEQFLAQADWSQLELAALEAIRGQARREFQAATPVDRRENQPLQARFDELMEQLSGQIAAKQEANREAKAALVRQAQGLLDSADPRQATDRAKELQARWKEIGHAQPSADRKLWKEFRAACDALFERRDSARAEREAARHAGLEAAESLCAEAEQLSGVPDAELAGAEERLGGLRAALEALETLPRDAGRGFAQRLKGVEEALAERRREIGRRRQAAARAAVEQRAELCARLEARLLAGPVEATDLDGLRAQWQALPELPADLAEPLRGRWARAQEAADGAAPFADQELADNQRRRRELTLRLEILAGVESPPEDRAQRMDLQVQRLAQGMAAGVKESPQAAARALEADWLGLGPSAAGAEDLQPRFRRALDALRVR